MNTYASTMGYLEATLCINNLFVSSQDTYEMDIIISFFSKQIGGSEK